MWRNTQYALLEVFSAEFPRGTAQEVANRLKHENDKTLKSWLKNLCDLKLLRRDGRKYYSPTVAGYKIVATGYVGLPYLRVLWGLAAASSPATLDEVYSTIGPSRNGEMREALRVGHVSCETAYRNKLYRKVYTLTEAGHELLVAYKPLRGLR